MIVSDVSISQGLISQILDRLNCCSTSGYGPGPAKFKFLRTVLYCARCAQIS